jgi:LmbE family N-acetylglucosaminyl deacetylase
MTQPLHVFYVPHSDDESLAMAGAIVDAVRRGAAVEIVLLTESLAQARIARRMKMSQQSANQRRRAEFVRACDALGVRALRFAELPEPLNDAESIAYEQGVRDRMELDLGRPRVPSVHLHTVAGVLDPHCSGVTHRSHVGAAAAGAVLRNQGHDVRFHCVYIYSHPMRQRSGLTAVTRVLDDGSRAAKRHALNAHAYGRRSVHSLFHEAMLDNREYEVVEC